MPSGENWRSGGGLGASMGELSEFVDLRLASGSRRD